MGHKVVPLLGIVFIWAQLRLLFNVCMTLSPLRTAVLNIRHCRAITSQMHACEPRLHPQVRGMTRTLVAAARENDAAREQGTSEQASNTYLTILKTIHCIL